MDKKRKEPGLGHLDEAADSERIPTLTDLAATDEGPTGEPPAAPPVEDPWATQDAKRERQMSFADSPSGGPDVDDYDFIEELTQAHTEPPPPSPRAAEPEPEPLPAPEPETPAEPESAASEPEAFTPEDVEALADRVLDQLAPALREAVATAVQELLARRRTRS